jgi:four helix bundle protein
MFVIHRRGRKKRRAVDECAGNPSCRGVRTTLEQRTKRFAVEVSRIVGALSPGQSGSVIVRQLSRSASATGADHRSASRARSKVDFLSKISIAEEEAGESQYGLELLSEVNVISASDFARQRS